MCMCMCVCVCVCVCVVNPGANNGYIKYFQLKSSPEQIAIILVIVLDVEAGRWSVALALAHKVDLGAQPLA